MIHTIQRWSQIALLASLVLSGFFFTTQVQAATSGDLVMCPEFDSVYFLADDGKRYVFPNENIYFSWYEDFNDVSVISCDDLADLTIGGVVFYQPGTDLVKIPSDPTVYIVEDDGLLRPLQGEDQAIALYGDDWAERVDDLDESFFGPYEVGEDLADDELPEGLILEDELDNLFRVDATGTAVEVDAILEAKLEALLREFALSFEGLAGKLEIEIEIESESEIDDAREIEIEVEFETIEVDDEDEIEVEELSELTDNQEDATDAITDAEAEISDAQIQITEDEEAGVDVSDRKAQLAQAEQSIIDAQKAFNNGDYQLAEELADDSDDLAHDAREELEDENSDGNEDDQEIDTDTSGSDDSIDDVTGDTSNNSESDGEDSSDDSDDSESDSSESESSGDDSDSDNDI